MTKWFDVKTNPPKKSGEYLVHMADADDPKEDLMDVDWYNSKTKEWASDWSSNMTRKQWTHCVKPPGYVGQQYAKEKF